MSDVSVEIPAPVPAGSVTSWSDDVDVLVVGAGMAGTCAAVEAARAGARVLLLDRGGPGTSTWAMSGGDFYLGGGTAVQQATGHEDSAEDKARYIVGYQPDATRRRSGRTPRTGSTTSTGWSASTSNSSGATTRQGGGATRHPGADVHRQQRRCWPVRELARPAPRGHKPPVVGDLGGGSFVVELALERLRRARRRGPLRHRRDGTRRRRRGRSRARVEEVRRDRRGPGRRRDRRRRRVRDEPGDDRGVTPRWTPCWPRDGPGQLLRRRPRDPPGRVRRRRGGPHGRRVLHTRSTRPGTP